MENEIKVNLKSLSKEEREQLMKLIEKANKESKIWKPEMDKLYYTVTATGTVRKYNWDDCYSDKLFYGIGNCFKTEEEAKFMIERLKVIAELQRFADEYNDKIEWNNSRLYKYYIIYNHSTKEVECDANDTFQHNDIYFSSEELCKQAVEKIGEDRIKKYYLRVEE